MKAGIGKVSITPPPGVPLAGFSARQEVSSGVHDELHARALVFENGGTAVALAAVDVLALPADFVDRVRRIITARVPLESEAILIASTHTHAGPVTISTFFNPEDTVDPRYMDRLAGAIAEAVATAWQTRFEARAGAGSARVEGIAVNRRSPEHGPVDEEIGILRVDDAAGYTRAVLMNYACHPTVLGPDNLLVTGDFPAFAIARVESSLPGAMAMFVNGTEGDISVGHSSELSAIGIIEAGRTFERAAALGARLGDAVLPALGGIVTNADLRLASQTLPVELPLKRFPPPEEAERALREAQTKSEILYASITRYYASEAAHFANGRLPIELQALRIGEALFVAVPAEVFVEIGLRVKRSAPGRIFIAGVANGYIGYLPSRHAYDAGGYEVVSSRCTPGAEDCLVEGVLQLARALE